MSGRIPQSFIDDLLTRVDIVDIVSRQVKLKKAGKNYSGLCPFHKEKTPSFSVSPDKQFYHCFGCGESGNALRFLLEHDRMEFVDAVEMLAQQCGIEVPREEATPQQKQHRKRVLNLLDYTSNSAQYYAQQLLNSEMAGPARDYLKKRGLSKEIITLFQLGYAPTGWHALSEHFKDQEDAQQKLIDTGLVIRNDQGKEYDRFRHRLMFPIRNVKGQIIGFGGRVLDDSKPKYLNSPETTLFSKSQELYGLYECRQHPGSLDRIMVVEGYMDVIALHQFGLHWAVATLGTATGSDHARKLYRLAPEIVYCFDGDDAGRRAAWKALNVSLSEMKAGRNARFLFLPEGEDPDSLIRKEGLDAFQERARTAPVLSDYLADQLEADYQPSNAEGKAALMAALRPLLASVQDSTYRRTLTQVMTERFKLPLENQSHSQTTAESGHFSSKFEPGSWRSQGPIQKPLSASVVNETTRLAAYLLRWPKETREWPFEEALLQQQNVQAQQLVAFQQLLIDKDCQTTYDARAAAKNTELEEWVTQADKSLVFRQLFNTPSPSESHRLDWAFRQKQLLKRLTSGQIKRWRKPIPSKSKKIDLDD